MLDGLYEEINNHQDLSNASKHQIMQKLNSDGSALADTYVISDEDCKIPKGDMMAKISITNLAKVLNWMRLESDDMSLVFHEFYKAHDSFKTSDPVFRQLVSALYSYFLISEEEKNTILRLGERKISRAEELFGRKIVKGDFE